MFGDDKGTLTLNHYLEATRRFREMPPVATRIYFVDRLEAYYRLSLICSNRKPEPSIPGMFISPPLAGVPLFNMRSAEYTEEMPSCCATPGIWAIMSDGTHKRLDGDESRKL